MVSLPASSAQRCFTSVSFSGAGFLVCYHIGVIQCFLQQGLLLKKGELPSESKTSLLLPLTGVSGGALAAAAVSAGVDPVDCLQAILHTNRQTGKAGILDALQPGFSLVDVAYEKTARLLREAVDYDSDFLLRRIDHGRLLRIGLTDRRGFPAIGRPMNDLKAAMIYVTRYRDMEDVIAACMSSCYIPGITGPVRGSLDARHGAIVGASERLNEMIRAGCVVSANGGAPIQCLPPNPNNSVNEKAREICWDGGLVDGFPHFDDKTLMVSPLAADFRSNPAINPAIAEGYSRKAVITRFLQVGPRVRMHLTTANLLRFRRLVLSSDDETLESVYQEGYDHALFFLRQNNLVRVVQHQTSPTVILNE